MRRLNGTVKNVMKLSFGTILGQGISLITLPIFTRVYGASIIGEWALITSVAAIINSFSDLGLINSIMIEDNEKKAFKVYKVVSTISFFICLLSSMAYGLYSYIFNNEKIYTFFLISIILFLWSFTMQQIQVCYTWLNRNKEYGILMKNPIINNCMVSFFAITLGLIGFKSYGYFISMIIGQIVTLIHMKFYIPKKLFTFKKNDYRYTLIKHRRFIIYQLPSTIILQFKAQLPTILFGRLFGKKLLGYYSISMRLLNVPITLLANSIGKVYFQRVSELKKDLTAIGRVTLKSIDTAMKISYLPMLGIIVLGDILFMFFFGNEYKVAGDLTRIMTLYGFFLFLSMSVSGVSIIINKQQFMLWSGIAQIVGIVFAFTIGWLFNSIFICLIMHSLSFILIQIVYFCSIFKYTHIKIKCYLGPLIKYILIGSILYIVLRIVIIKIGLVDTL